MKTKKPTTIKVWKVTSPTLSSEDDNQQIESVYFRALEKDIAVIKPDALDEVEHTRVGVINPNRKRYSADKLALASIDSDIRIDVLERMRISKLIGYLPTDAKGLYLEVRKRRILPFILIASLLAAAIVAAILLFPNTPWSPDIDPNQGKPAHSFIAAETAEGTTQIPGYGDVVNINKDNPYVSFVNPQGNKVYFIFSVTYKDKEVYRSKMVEPGKAVNWNAYTHFGGEAGSYPITLTTDSCAMDNGAICNGGVQSFTVRIVN